MALLRNWEQILRSNQNALLRNAQRAYDTVSMTIGLCLILATFVWALWSLRALFARRLDFYSSSSSLHSSVSLAGKFVNFVPILAALSLASSSFVEEEHQTWYFFSMTWLFCGLFDCALQNEKWGGKSRGKTALSLVSLCIIDRVARMLNQTGDKWRHLPDLSDVMQNWSLQSKHAFVFANLLASFVVIFVFEEFAASYKTRKTRHSRRRRHATPPARSSFTSSFSFSTKWSAFKRGCFALCILALIFLHKAISLSLADSKTDQNVGESARISQYSHLCIPIALLTHILICLFVLYTYQLRRPITSNRYIDDDVVISDDDDVCVDDHHRVINGDACAPPCTHPLQLGLAFELMLIGRWTNLPLWLLLFCKLRLLGNIPPFCAEKTVDDDVTARVGGAAVQRFIVAQMMGSALFFQQGNSHSLATIELSAGYVGLFAYNPVCVAALLALNTFAGPLFWMLTSTLLHRETTARLRHHLRHCRAAEREEEEERRRNYSRYHHHQQQQQQRQIKKQQVSLHHSQSTANQRFECAHYTLIGWPLVCFFAVCFDLRSHLFVWSVFAPKFLYLSVQSILLLLILQLAF